jgi:hypothetical protein
MRRARHRQRVLAAAKQMIDDVAADEAGSADHEAAVQLNLTILAHLLINPDQIFFFVA